MSAVYQLGSKGSEKRVAVIRGRGNEPLIQVGNQSFNLRDMNKSLAKFYDFWDLMQTIKTHGYLRAAMGVVGRTSVGAWWTLRKHPEYDESQVKALYRKRLMRFYLFENRQWDNIKDYQSIAYKLIIGTMYLRYFGKAAFHVVRDEDGAPLGLDFLPGLVVPNVDEKGFFKDPAFTQYPTNDLTVKYEFASPRDIIYVMNPDWEGTVFGGSDIESLAEYTLPLDLYLMIAAREYMKNRDKPEVVYELAADISSEAFDTFVKEMDAKHAGAKNVGRSSIAVQGDFKVHELRPLPESLPFQESRRDARQEELAAAGVHGSKLGLTEEMSAANLREVRREFHETSMLPLFRLIELAFYEQINVREFGIKALEFKFNAPDFLTAVERATVHTRYHTIGVQNPNEIRFEIGMSPRDDELGDLYIDELTGSRGTGNLPGSPTDGRPAEPDDPSQTGEPMMDDDPPRGDGHDDDARSLMVDELKHWKTFVEKRIKKGRKPGREFRTEHIPDDIRARLQIEADKCQTVSDVTKLFNDVIEIVGRGE
jgi:hypothetical protein